MSHYCIQIFAGTWKSYLAQWDKNEAHKRLLKFTTETVTEKKTVEAIEEVKKEPSVDMKQLQQLIQKEATKRTRDLEKEMSKLKLKLENLKVSPKRSNSKSDGDNKKGKSGGRSPKNSPRRGRAGASTKQQNGTKNQQA